MGWSVLMPNFSSYQHSTFFLVVWLFSHDNEEVLRIQLFSQHIKPENIDFHLRNIIKIYLSFQYYIVYFHYCFLQFL